LKPKPLLIDTNLLVLFIVGAASKEYITKHKKLTEFTVQDYEVLVEIISQAPAVLVTPNILTETSNLAAYIREPARRSVLDMFRRVAATSQERYMASSLAVQRPEFLRLGLTDAVLVKESIEDVVLLTTDLGLYCAALAQGAEAVNFNHIRDQYL
jgi:hypothetical protein